MHCESAKMKVGEAFGKRFLWARVQLLCDGEEMQKVGKERKASQIFRVIDLQVVLEDGFKSLVLVDVGGSNNDNVTQWWFEFCLLS